MIDLQPRYFNGRDGVRLAYLELGEGRPVLLLHGFLGSGEAHWLRPGHAANLAQLGYRVLMPDLRGHASSGRPHDRAAYPPDVLASDGLDLIEHLELSDYDLGGYSLGARTTVRMLDHGAAPARAIVAGMGLEGIVHTAGRGGRFRNILSNFGSFSFGSPEWKAEAYLKKIGADPVALLNVLETSIDTPLERLAEFELPTLVVAGVEDGHNDTAEALADALPNGRHLVVAGDHTTAITRPELGLAIGDFLTR